MPGAYEVPVTVLRAAKTEQYEAVIALGAVIRGSTPHFDMVAGEVTKGVAMASMQTGIPCIFGVLTQDKFRRFLRLAKTPAEGWGLLEEADSASNAR